MPSFHLHETDTPLYPIHTRILEDFLGMHDFIPNITPDYTIFKKGNLLVKVPHLKRLSRFQVASIIKRADIPLSIFEQYYQHLQAMSVFDQLIDLSGGTLKD